MSAGPGFTDNISGNLELVKELLQGIPADARNRAKRAAVCIEAAWEKVRKDSQDTHDPAVVLGAVFAIFMLADRMVQAERDGESRPLIQLLS